MRSEYGARGTADGCDLFKHHHQVFVAATPTTGFLSDAQTQQPQFSEALHLTSRKLFLAIYLNGTWSNLVGGEPGNGVPEQFLLFRVEGLHGLVPASGFDRGLSI